MRNRTTSLLPFCLLLAGAFMALSGAGPARAEDCSAGQKLPCIKPDKPVAYSCVTIAGEIKCSNAVKGEETSCSAEGGDPKCKREKHSDNCTMIGNVLTCESGLRGTQIGNVWHFNNGARGTEVGNVFKIEGGETPDARADGTNSDKVAEFSPREDAKCVRIGAMEFCAQQAR